MKKVTLVILMFANYCLYAQYLREYHCDYTPGNTESETNSFLRTSGPNSEFGGVFTPKGDLKILVITAGFGEPYDSNGSFEDWPIGTNTLPAQFTNGTVFYSSNSAFNNPIVPLDIKNLSRYYYTMSNGTFRLTADVYPTRINISLTGCGSWNCANRKVMEKFKEIDPNFNWSQYDKRKNWSNYLNDNSSFNPDNKPDYVVIVYRKYSNTINGINIGWTGTGGGVSRLGGLSNFTFNGYTFDASGFTYPAYGGNSYGMFLHEIGHELYACPHYGGANGACGNFYYLENSWGMMNTASSAFSCANGWERWILGWSELKANNINSDIQSQTDLQNGGIYELRDFINTGDVVRLKIPNGAGKSQYLWLENHTGNNIYDKRLWDNNGCGNPFPSSPTGLVAYYESIADDKNTNLSYNLTNENTNTIKILNPNGNFNYSPMSLEISPCNLWWNNVIDFQKGDENCFAGQSNTSSIRADYNTDPPETPDVDEIKFNPDYNGGNMGNGKRNENASIQKENGMYNYAALASNINIPIGRKLGISSNPPISNRPYLGSDDVMGSYFINNISFEVLEKLPNNNIKVKIRFDDNIINDNRIWAGNIVLGDVSGNTNPDLILNNGKTLIFQKNLTKDKSFLNYYLGDFTNPSIFQLNENSKTLLKENSSLIVKQHATLIINNLANLELENNSKITIESGGMLIIKNGSNIKLLGKSNIDIKAGGYICLENGANILLNDIESSINLLVGFQSGVNSALIQNQTGCISQFENLYSSFGLGKLNVAQTYMYIQNENFTSNNQFLSKNLFIGKDVTNTKPQGAVIFNSGTNTLIKSNEVLIKNDTEIKLGATFEILLTP